MLNQEFRLSRLRLFCLILLIVGIVFRFVNLDRKVYWHDEVYTSLRISAHSRSELVERAFTGGEVTVDELQQFQRLDPNRSMEQAIRLLGIEDSQHPPLYYILARLWAQSFGDSVAVIRSLSAVFSLLVFPCLYWLCLELFGSALVGWVAIALFAISPFQVLFAQEAREYSLWMVTILLSNVALLRAVRRQSWLNWIGYSLSLTLAFYSFLFSGLVAIGHGLYVLGNEKNDSLSIAGFRLSRRAFAYLIASLAAVLLFSPWFYFLITYSSILGASTSWTQISLPPDIFIKLWGFNLSRIFVDFDLDLNQPIAYWIVIPVVLLELYALGFLMVHTPKRVWLFVLTWVTVPMLALLLPDLVLGGQRSTVARYLIPSYLGIELAVSYLLAHQLRLVNKDQQQIWRSIAAVVVAVGVISCGLSAQADTWWTKVISYHNPAIARRINASDRPVLVSDAFGINPGNIVSLSYLLDPKTKLFLLPEVGKTLIIPEFSEDFSDVFLLNLPDFFRSQFEEKYQEKLALPIENLWQLEQSS